VANLIIAKRAKHVLSQEANLVANLGNIANLVANPNASNHSNH